MIQLSSPPELALTLSIYKYDRIFIVLEIPIVTKKIFLYISNSRYFLYSFPKFCSINTIASSFLFEAHYKL